MRAKQIYLVLLVAQLSLGLIFATTQAVRAAAPGRAAWLCAFVSEAATLRVFAVAYGRGSLVVVAGGAVMNLLAAACAILLTPPALLRSPLSPAALALLATLCWLVFDTWFAKQDTRAAAGFLSKPGTTVPDFALLTTDGRAVRAAALTWPAAGHAIGKTSARAVGGAGTAGTRDEPAVPAVQLPRVLLIFIRGNWCTVCMAQINSFVEAAPLMSAHGVAVHFVSSQGMAEQRRLETLLKRTPYGVLQDTDNALAAKWGLLSRGAVPPLVTAGLPDAAIPAAVLLERDRTSELEAIADNAPRDSGMRLVRAWLSGDYRHRVEPLEVVAALGPGSASSRGPIRA